MGIDILTGFNDQTPDIDGVSLTLAQEVGFIKLILELFEPSNN